MRPLFILILACSAIVSTAQANDCIRSRAVYQTVQTQYVAPAVVAVPSYQYTNNYATTLLVPQVLEVPTYAPNHVYSISEGYQAAQVIEAMGKVLKEQRDALQGQPAQQPPPAPQQPAPVPQPLVQPQSRPQSSGRPSSFQDPNLVSLIQSSCVKCHQAQNKMPLLTPDGKGLLDLTRQQALTTYWLVNTGAMPKTAPPVDDKFMPLFSKWIEASK